MNKFDLRFQKTEEMIINAFLKVAAGSSFEQIRIKDICAVAMISRNAFYAHYADKYELLESICESLKEKMILGLTPVMVHKMANHQLNESTDWCIDMIYENREILKTLSHCVPERLRRLLQDVFITGTLEALYENPQEILRDPLLNMGTIAISNLLIGCVVQWLDTMDEVSRDEMVTFVKLYMHEPCIILYRKISAHPEIKERKPEKKRGDQ